MISHPILNILFYFQTKPFVNMLGQPPLKSTAWPECELEGGSKTIKHFSWVTPSSPFNSRSVRSFLLHTRLKCLESFSILCFGKNTTSLTITVALQFLFLFFCMVFLRFFWQRSLIAPLGGNEFFSDFNFLSVENLYLYRECKANKTYRNS